MINQKIIKYSDAELQEFKRHIENKLREDEAQEAFLYNQIQNSNESSSNEGDWMDDSSNMQNIEMMSVMINRQRKHIQDLKNALIRIENKVYGICVATGELIDKDRLMAVPTTTKSVRAKESMVKGRRAPSKPRPRVTTSERKIITKVIKRQPVNGVEKKQASLEDDFLTEENQDDNFNLLDDLIFDSNELPTEE